MQFRNLILIPVLAVSFAGNLSAEESGCTHQDKPIVVISDTGAKISMSTNTASGWCQTATDSIDNPVWKPNGESGGNGGESSGTSE
jgi:hypothetical protein